MNPNYNYYGYPTYQYASGYASSENPPTQGSQYPPVSQPYYQPYEQPVSSAAVSSSYYASPYYSTSMAQPVVSSTSSSSPYPRSAFHPPPLPAPPAAPLRRSSRLRQRARGSQNTSVYPYSHPTSEETAPFACQVAGCSFTSKARSDFTRHQHEVHEKRRTIVCECGKDFKRLEHWRTHSLTTGHRNYERRQ